MAIGRAVKTWSLPDPDTLKHAHVIIPLADVTPNFIHPSGNKPLKSIAQDVCGKDDFRSFFPVTQMYLAYEISSNGVETKPLPGALEIKDVAADKPLKNGSHLNGFNKPGSKKPEVGFQRPVALITGAAKRLGACIATRLHEIGYNVVVHYNTSETEATDLVKQLNR